MNSAYSPDTEAVHRNLKFTLQNSISAPRGDLSIPDYFSRRSEIIDQSLTENISHGVLAVLEWNLRHAPLRTLDSVNTPVAQTLGVKMREEVREYCDVLEVYSPSELESETDVDWYARKSAKSLWKVGGEMVDADIFAIGILEALGFTANQIVGVVDRSVGSVDWMKGLQDDEVLPVLWEAREAISVINNVGYHAIKLGLPIGALIFYKSMQNETHRSQALRPEYQSSGFSKTLRRSIGSPVWDRKLGKNVLDSQIPALAQSWIGPTVIETHIEPTEYHTSATLPLNNLRPGGTSQFSSIYQNPNTIGAVLQEWRST